MEKRHLTVPAVIKELEKLYDPPKSFLLHWKTPHELLVATILSAQCTDDRVNKVTPELFKKYRRPEDYLNVPQTELEDDIHSCGYYRAKAKAIQGMSRMVIEDYKHTVPDSIEELTKLPGVGRKTAAIIAHVVHGRREGIAVDTHVIRLSKRLGFTKGKSQRSIELDLMKQTPEKDWARLNPLLISHGRAVCTAIGRTCDACVFQDRCPSSWTRGKKDLAKE